MVRDRGGEFLRRHLADPATRAAVEAITAEMLDRADQEEQITRWAEAGEREIHPGRGTSGPASQAAARTLLRNAEERETNPPVHPGEVLRTEFLEPLNLSAYQIARAISVPQTRLSQILQGRRSITADTGLRLSRVLGLSDMFWINMQARYDAETARDNLAEELKDIRPLVGFRDEDQ